MIHHKEINTESDDRTSKEIEKDVNQVRSRMDHTIDELGERLRPKNLASDLVEAFLSSVNGDTTKQTMKNVARRVGTLVRDHPGPALLIGGGIAWSLMSLVDDDEDDEGSHVEDREFYIDPAYGGVGEYGHVASESTPGAYADDAHDENSHSKASAAKEKLGSVASAVRGAGSSAGKGIRSAASSAASSVGHAGSKAGHAIGSAASSAARSGRDVSKRAGRGISEQYHHAEDMFLRASREAPLGVGFGLLGLGVLAGLLLPSTRKEDKWLGEQSDDAYDAVKEAGSEVIRRGKKVASHAASKAMEEAERQGFTSEGLSRKAVEVGDAAVEVAKTATEETKKAAKEENLTPKEAVKGTTESQKNPSGQTGNSAPAPGENI